MAKKSATVLHVDDCQMTRHIIKHMCEHNGTTIYSTSNTSKAYSILSEVEVDIMLVDIDLNGESGLLFVRDIRQDQRFNHIGISMLTSSRDEEMLRMAVSYGADDYMIKPFSFTRVMETVQRLKSGANLPVDWKGLSPQQSRLLRTASSTIGYAFTEASEGKPITISQVQKGALTTIQALEDKRLIDVLAGLKQENGQSYIHSLRMGALLSMYAIKMNYDHKTLREYATGGILHDIGLTKHDGVFFDGESWIDDRENKIHKNHTVSGYNLLKRSNRKCSPIILNCAREHHERIDGSGALGLRGEEISEAGRIAAISDIYANLTDKTAKNRTPMSKAEAIDMIESARSVNSQTLEVFKSIVLT
jgi:putative nucleotidyltransferase with HDIG domain